MLLCFMSFYFRRTDLNSMDLRTQPMLRTPDSYYGDLPKPKVLFKYQLFVFPKMFINTSDFKNIKIFLSIAVAQRLILSLLRQRLWVHIPPCARLLIFISFSFIRRVSSIRCLKGILLYLWYKKESNKLNSQQYRGQADLISTDLRVKNKFP